MAAPREPRYLELAPTLLPNGMQVSVHTSPRLLAGELASVLPAHRSALDGARILATAQRAVVDLVQIGPDVEKEKDRLLETFVSWATGVCGALVAEGFWADYIDPCSGMPGLSCRSSTVFSEVDSFELLLRYKTSNAGCCKVLHHPVWGSAVYPASVITNAPLEAVTRAMGIGTPAASVE